VVRIGDRIEHSFDELLHAGRILARPSCPSAGRGGFDLLGRSACMELAIGRELLGILLLVAALLAVMWILAHTRRSPR